MAHHYNATQGGLLHAANFFQFSALHSVPLSAVRLAKPFEKASQAAPNDGWQPELVDVTESLLLLSPDADTLRDQSWKTFKGVLAGRVD